MGAGWILPSASDFFHSSHLDRSKSWSISVLVPSLPNRCQHANGLFLQNELLLDFISALQYCGVHREYLNGFHHFQIDVHIQMVYCCKTDPLWCVLSRRDSWYRIGICLCGGLRVVNFSGDPLVLASSILVGNNWEGWDCVAGTTSNSRCL